MRNCLAGLQHHGKAPDTEEKRPADPDCGSLVAGLFYSEGYQSTNGSGPQQFQGPHYCFKLKYDIEEGLQCGNEQTGERNLEETETMRRGGKT